MPLDPLSSIQAGDPGPIPVTAWNRMLELVRRDQATRAGRSGGGPMVDSVQATTTVLVQNDTGSAASHGYCLAVTDIPTDATTNPPEWLTRPVLTGDVPASTSDPFVVLLEPLSDGAVGRAAIAGLALAQVDVTDTSHEYATPTAADATKLTSATSGPARILWTETGGTGTQACLLMLGDSSAGTSLTVKESDGSPSYANVSSLEVDQAQGGVITQPGANRVKLSWGSASLTTPGVVDTTAQTLAGAKSFKDFTTFHDEIVVQNGYTGATYPTLTDPARVNLKETQLSPGGGLFSSQVMAYREDYATPVSGYYNHVVATRIVSGSVYLQTLLKYDAETGVHTFELHRGAFTGSAVSGSATTCAYAIDGLLGGTATLGGMEFTGGIYTDGTLTVDLTSEVTGALPTGNGGIGLTTTPPAGSVLAGNGSGYEQTPAHVLTAKWTLTV